MMHNKMSQNTSATARIAQSVQRRPSVLIVEDNVALGESLEILLENNSFDVSRTTDGVGGLRNVKLMDFDVILCDMVMPDLNGDLFYLAVERVKPHLCSRFIFMTGHQDDPKWEQFARRTCSLLLGKPFPLDALVNAIRAVLKKNLLNELRTISELQCLSAEELDFGLNMGTSPNFGVKKTLWPGPGPQGMGWAVN
jgi:DNA-binding NtrC family response regulator